MDKEFFWGLWMLIKIFFWIFIFIIFAKMSVQLEAITKVIING